MDAGYRFIKGYEGRYMVNKAGQVLSLISNKGGDGIHPVKVSDRGTVKLMKNGEERHLSLKFIIERTFNVCLDGFVPVREFPFYMINKSGEIYSSRMERFIFPHKDRKGYMRIALAKDGKQCTRRVHRLVATTFIPNPKNKPQVNHKDGNKENNHVDNLEWVTNLENMRHAWDNGYFDCHKAGNREYAKKS